MDYKTDEILCTAISNSGWYVNGFDSSKQLTSNKIVFYDFQNGETYKIMVETNLSIEGKDYQIVSSEYIYIRDILN